MINKDTVQETHPLNKQICTIAPFLSWDREHSTPFATWDKMVGKKGYKFPIFLKWT